MENRHENQTPRQKTGRGIYNPEHVARLPIWIGMAVAVGMLLGASLFGGGDKADIGQQADKFYSILSHIDRYYVDTVDANQLTERAIGAMLEKLDPHTTYIPSEQVEMANAPLEGEFEGVGIEYNIFHDTVHIISTISGGPSEKAGLMAGDKIVEVDGNSAVGLGQSGVVETLRGEKGSKVEVGVVRRGADEVLRYTLTRDKIPVYTVDASYMVDKKTGYVKISRFGNDTYNEFMRALRKLKRDGMKRLLIDLRDNGGGYLERTVRIADELLDDDRLILYTDGKDDRFDETWKAHRKGAFEKGPVIVLVNEYSASASEILSGALQDNDRGLIVGRRTYGKGLVQRQVELPDGSEMRLTISRYYTPSGRSIQKPYDQETDYNAEIAQRYEHGEFFHLDSIHLDESLRFQTKHGRTVYGGGGVMPDVFIARDTSYYSPLSKGVYERNLHREFAHYYANERKAELEKLEPQAFAQSYPQEAQMIEAFRERCRQEGLDPDGDQWAVSGQHLATVVKAYVARNVWGLEAFFPIYNRQDDIYLQALTLFDEAEKIEKKDF